MATVQVYRLQPRSAFHFGDRGVGLEETSDTFRSDALFSALSCVIQEGWGSGELEQLLGPFLAGEPPFLLSSCFPFAGRTLFFPAPMLPARLMGVPGEELAKRLKRTRFVSQGVFRRWLAGDDLGSETLAENFVPASGAWTSGAEQPEVAALAGMVGEAEERALWARDDVPRVTVDRETSASAVYRVGRLSFRPGCGLFFLVDWRQESFRPRIEQALSLLADAGLGGRRSVGYGQFTPEEPYTLELGEVPMPTAAVTLSLYWPTPDELGRGALGPQAQYSLVTRHGWMASPWGRAVRRRQVRMLAEGSAIDAGARPVGGLVDVTPAGFGAHPVYRYGLAFPVGVAPGVRSSPEAGS